MKWQDLPRSENVEDRRGFRLGRPAVVGGSGVALLVVLFMTLCGADPSQLLRILQELDGSSVSVDGPPDAEYPSSGAPGSGAPAGPAGDDQLADFVSVVLADTEKTWSGLFAQSGERYRPPRLVLFTDAVDSACGLGSSAMGPFYCPADEKLYIDLGFYDELRDRFGATGDFAQAYVIAHEVGHHVQNLLGIQERMEPMGNMRRGAAANADSVRLELQADCLAGVWAHHANRSDLLDPGDIDEGLRAAAAIGDDRIQRMSHVSVSPESWTHGSSAQRARWFRQGFENGSVSQCDTSAEGS